MDIKKLLLLHGEKPIVAVVLVFCLFMISAGQMDSVTSRDIKAGVDEIIKRFEQIKDPIADAELPNKYAEYKKAWFEDIGDPNARIRPADFWATADAPPYERVAQTVVRIDVKVDPPQDIKAKGFRTFARLSWKRHDNHVWIVPRRGPRDNKILVQKLKRGKKGALVKGFLIKRKDVTTGKVFKLNDGNPITIDGLLTASARKTRSLVRDRGRSPAGETGMGPGGVPGEFGEPGAGAAEGPMPEGAMDGGAGMMEDGMRGARQQAGPAGITWYPAPLGDFVYYDRDVETGHEYLYTVAIVIEDDEEKGVSKNRTWTDKVKIEPELLWTFQSVTLSGASITIFRYIEIENLGGYWESVNAFVRKGDKIGYPTNKKVHAIDMEKLKKAEIDDVADLDSLIAPNYIKSESKPLDFATNVVVVDLVKGTPMLTVENSGKGESTATGRARDMLLYIDEGGKLERMVGQKRKDFIESHGIILPTRAVPARRTGPGRTTRGVEGGPPMDEFGGPEDGRGRSRRSTGRERSSRRSTRSRRGQEPEY